MKIEMSDAEKIILHGFIIGLIVMTSMSWFNAPKYVTYGTTAIIFVMYYELALINNKLRGWNDYQSSKVKK